MLLEVAIWKIMISIRFSQNLRDVLINGQFTALAPKNNYLQILFLFLGSNYRCGQCRFWGHLNCAMCCNLGHCVTEVNVYKRQVVVQHGDLDEAWEHTERP